MDSVHDLLKSEELKSIVAAVEALNRRVTPNRPATGHRFRDLTLGDQFNVAAVLRILSGEEAYYPGFKPVLAAGLAGTLFDEPDSNVLAFDGMCRAALEHLAAANTKAGLASRRWDLGRDILARYVFAGNEFLSEIVDELGGYDAFMGASSREVAEIISESSHLKWNTVIRALAYFHYGADLWRKGVALRPSLNRAVLIFAGLKDLDSDYSQKFVSRSLLHDHWTKSKSKLALVYSATTLSIGDRTLFQILAEQDFSYNRHKKILNRWMSRARFVSSHIFSCATDQQLQKTTDELLGIGPIEKFSPPPLSAGERRILKKSFQGSEDEEAPSAT